MIKPNRFVVLRKWGTLHQIGDDMIEAFLTLTPEEQAEIRKATWEKITGEPYEDDPYKGIGTTIQ